MRQWHEMLARALAGERRGDRTGVGTTSAFGGQWEFDLRTGFPLVTTKRVPPRWCFEELAWMLRGSTDEGELRAKGVDVWKEWATPEQCAKFGREPGDLGPVYGKQLRRFGQRAFDVDEDGNPWAPRPVDQVVEALRRLRKDPWSRRNVVTLWDPRDVEEVSVPPCPCFFQLYAHADRSVSMHLYQRSADVFLGAPFDVAEFALLTHALAWAVGTRPNRLVVSYGDLHLYSNHEEQAREVLSRKPRPAPRLTIDRLRDPWGREDVSDLDALLSLRWEDVVLAGYDPWPKIEASVAV